MRSKYWIKLYHEILTDPKMGRLPDNEWRRCIELFLLAGEIKEGGQLPDTEDIAWYLHVDTSQLQGELEHLQQVGIITKNDDGWYVSQFAKRQAPVSDAERQRRYRMRKDTESEPEQSDELEAEDRPEPSQDNDDIVTSDVTNGNGVTTRNADNRYTDIDTDKRGGKKRQPPPAFYIYTEITGHHKITRYWRTKMADTVGEKREDLALWAAVIKGWTGKGWFVGNVEGMLDYFNRREIPGEKSQKARQNANALPAKELSDTAKEVYERIKSGRLEKAPGATGRDPPP